MESCGCGWSEVEKVDDKEAFSRAGTRLVLKGQGEAELGKALGGKSGASTDSMRVVSPD